MTTVPINDLSRWDSSELNELSTHIRRVLESGHFMLGSNTKALETHLGERLGGRNVVCVGNGTDAITVALAGLGLQPGDKVATVANAGGYATGVLLRMQCIPVFVDIDPSTAQISIASFKETVSLHPDLKAVVVTHLYGLMADIDGICDIAHKNDIRVVEDCAQAIGASLDLIEAGAWGDASTFSFYPTKNLGCLGDGGAVAFRDPTHADLARRIAQYGWSERYTISENNGFNTRIDEIQAAILLVRAKSLNTNNERRRTIVRAYAASLSDKYSLVWKDDLSYVGHLAVLICPDRENVQSVLHQHEIGHGVHYPISDHQQPAWKSLFKETTLPNTEALVNSIITIPCFPSMRESEIHQVCTTLSDL